MFLFLATSSQTLILLLTDLQRHKTFFHFQNMLFPLQINFHFDVQATKRRCVWIHGEKHADLHKLKHTHTNSRRLPPSLHVSPASVCVLCQHKKCVAGPGVNIGPLAPAAPPHTSPQRDRSPSEWSQAVSIHLQMNSALFHQRTPPSPPSLPQPLASSSSSLLLALFFCPFFPPLAPSFPSSLSLSVSLSSLFVPVMKSAITVRTRTTLKYQKPLICD